LINDANKHLNTMKNLLLFIYYSSFNCVSNSIIIDL